MSKETYVSRWGHKRTHVKDGSARRDKRREEALARQDARNKRSIPEQLERLLKRPGASAREGSRLFHRYEERITG